MWSIFLGSEKRKKQRESLEPWSTGIRRLFLLCIKRSKKVHTILGSPEYRVWAASSAPHPTGQTTWIYASKPSPSTTQTIHLLLP